MSWALKFNAQILDQSYEALYSLREYDEKLIVPGFFGISRQGYVVTFPRGGSDITGAIVARASAFFTIVGLALKIPETSVKFSYKSARTPRATIAPVISDPPRGKVTT